MKEEAIPVVGAAGDVLQLFVVVSFTHLSRSSTHHTQLTSISCILVFHQLHTSLVAFLHLPCIMNITVASKEPEQVMEAQVSAAEAGPSAESSVTTENVEETVQAQTSAVEPDSSSESFSTKADDESYQEMDTPRTSVSTLDADLPAMLAQVNLNIRPSNDRDGMSVMRIFSIALIEHWTVGSNRLPPV